MTSAVAETMYTPGKSRGLLDLYRHGYLLLLLVRKELRVRYRGSVLGLAWSYVKPAVQFAVFYYAMGEFLRLADSFPPFAVYLFSGVILVNLFSESFSNGTRSILENAPLVKKIYLPRELFPVASLLVALVHFFPQLVILMIGAWSTGWQPGPLQIAGAIGGFLIVAIFGLGLGMLFGAINVAYRDVQNIVDLILMVAVWLSPVLYPWTLVQKQLQGFWYHVYMGNPLTVAVELYHASFWFPQAEALQQGRPDRWTVPPDLMMNGFIALGISLATLFVGQLVFKRLEGRFAQEL